MRVRIPATAFSLAIAAVGLLSPAAARAQGAPWWAWFLPRDNASIVRHDIPATMTAGAEVDVVVEVKNTGRDAWRFPDVKLGAVGDAAGHAARFTAPNPDPTRVWLAPGAVVGYRRNHVFRFRLRAPAQPGIYVPQFRMVHEGVRWFGATARRVVRVDPPPTPGPGPNPSPNPGPNPNPNPNPTSLPPIRIVGNRFEPALFGLIECCAGPAPNDNAKGWPLVAPEWVDSFASAGANLTHVRTGPFSDQGYGWGLVLNQLRENVQYANSKGLYVEVDLVDNWALAHRQPNLYDDDCSITQGPPPVHYQHWVREIVRVTGDLGVLYNLGNEGFRCQPSQAWEDGLYAVAKQALRDFGYPDRPVGSTFNLNRVNRKLYDYATQHGFGLQNPLSVPTILNESDNRHHSPEEWWSLVDHSRANGTYIAIWRGPIDDPEWNRLIAHYGGRPSVVAPVQPTATYLAYPRSYAPGPDNNATLVREVEIAVEKAIQAAPWNYRNGGDHLIRNDEVSRTTHFSLVQAFLQPRAVEVGDPTKPWTGRDSLDVSRNPTPCPSREGVFEGYHLINFGGGGVFRGGNIRNAFRGTVRHGGGPSGGCP